LRPGIHAERVAREGGSTRSAYLEKFTLAMRSRAPAGTTAQALSQEEGVNTAVLLQAAVRDDTGD